MPGRVRGPAVTGNSGWTPGGHGMTAVPQHQPPSLAGREHLAGPRTVNAPPLSLRGGIYQQALPKGVQSIFVPPGKGRGVAGLYMNEVGAGASPSFVVPNTNHPYQGMTQSGRLIIYNIVILLQLHELPRCS